MENINSLILAGTLKYVVKTVKQYILIEHQCGYNGEYKKESKLTLTL